MKIKKIKNFTVPFAIFENQVETSEKEAYLSLVDEFDEQGNIIKGTKFLEDGSIDEQASFVYDEKGRLTEEIQYFALTENEDKRKIEYFDTENKVTETYYYGDDPGERVIIVNDDEGNPLQIERYDLDGQLESRKKYSYYKPGLVAEEEDFDGIADATRTVRNFYDDKDILIRQEITSTHPDEISQVIHIEKNGLEETSKAFDMDSKPLYLRIRQFDADGNLLKFTHQDHGADEFTEMTIEYDDKKRPVSEDWKANSGQLLKKQTFQYNDEGFIAEELYFEPNPYIMENNHSLRRFEYEYY
jgi:hypothetical protein